MSDKIELPPYGERLLTMAGILLTGWRDLPKTLTAFIVSCFALVLVLVLPLTIIALPLWVWLADRTYIRTVRHERAKETLRKAMSRAFGDGQ